MLKNKSLNFIFFTILGILALACKKEPDLIGLDLLPAGDRLSIDFTDTSGLVAYTVREDSLRTDELSLNLLGSISDPVFGVTNASIFTEYSLSKSNISFGDNPVADSLVLTLTYKGVYGDSMAQHTVRVYELADTLYYDGAYYSNNDTVQVLPELIGQATFVPNFEEADSVDGEFVSPHLRIMLSQEFANRLLSADSATLANNENFQNVFKGLYLSPQPVTTPGTGSIIYFNLLDAVSRLKLYYHNDSDTTSIEFPIGSYSARFTHFDHGGYAGASPLLTQQLSGDTTSGSQRLFIQAMAGTKVKVRIPNLKSLAATKRIAVNEALLIVRIADTSGVYAIPGQIAVREITSTGTLVALPDEEDEGSTFVDGTASSGTEYHFRITRYIQNRLLNPDEPDYGLMLIAVGSSLNSNRVILYGPGAEGNQMKLQIYYTLVE